LKGDRAFVRLRRGKSGGARLLSLRWLATREGEVRVGIVVSKKVGKAVVRNRVRRRLREALRDLLRTASWLPAACYRGKPSLDLIVIARSEAAEANYAQLRGALYAALKRSKVLA
jgi:ribonuclease P protein component